MENNKKEYIFYKNVEITEQEIKHYSKYYYQNFFSVDQLKQIEKKKLDPIVLHAKILKIQNSLEK